jgi:hypothetical protein
MISKENYQLLALDFGLPISSIKAIDEVESSGEGFDPSTGKIKIQFEPSWFNKLAKILIPNGVENQAKEWLAFNKAYAKNPQKAMESTSIGRMQVMGMHWKRLGFKSVDAMWDFAKKSEANQLWLGLKFIQTDKRIFKAVLAKDWKTVAYLYNGSLYWQKKYDVKLANAEIKNRS